MSPYFAASALAGTALALAFAAWLRALAIGLLVLPLCYVAFALAAGEFDAVSLEAIGVLVYGALAWRGERRPWLLSVGWLAHIVWDLAMPGAHAAYVPAFYGPLCLGFDAVIGVHAWRLQARLSAGAGAAAPDTR